MLLYLYMPSKIYRSTNNMKIFFFEIRIESIIWIIQWTKRWRFVEQGQSVKQETRRSVWNAREEGEGVCFLASVSSRDIDSRWIRWPAENSGYPTCIGPCSITSLPFLLLLPPWESRKSRNSGLIEIAIKLLGVYGIGSLLCL